MLLRVCVCVCLSVCLCVCVYEFLLVICCLFQDTRTYESQAAAVSVCVYLCVYVCGCVYLLATIRRFLKIVGLLCRIYLFHMTVLQKRPVILRSLLIVATPFEFLLAISHLQDARTSVN